MADARYSSNKSRRKSPELSKQQRQRNRHKTKKYDARQKIDSRTPPLPTTSNLAELIKQRESLKNEINKIDVKRHDSVQIYNVDPDLIRTMQTNKSNRYKIVDLQDNKKLYEKSPELNKNISDSEDEEIIIELRRIKRRQLLEKINSEKLTNELENDEGSQYLTVKDGLKSPALVNISSNITKDASEKETTEDMFSEKSFDSNKIIEQITHDSSLNLSENWDDPEGYYNIIIGDVINNRNYTIKRVVGQGVFANVIVAEDNCNKTEVAIKIMRNNELIYKTGLKELELLKEINEADPENKYHCIKYITNFFHKGHLCVVLEPLYMDMRKVIKKYGRRGLNIKAVMSYSRQLLLALRHLKKLGIIHADVKPDNILVNEKKNILKLCDFGSATKANENDATPYLVSRFYRAPEIILGIPYKHSIDVWSAACTIYEMATGKIMFIGSSNNKMLKCFMDLKGKFPNKLIRKGIFKEQHFNYNNNYLLRTKDELCGREKNIELCNIIATRSLLLELKKVHSNPTRKLEQLKDLLENMLILDSSKRFSIVDCLKHPFIQEKL